MTERNTGGPAFPLHNHGVQTLGMHLSGMTLRDYFAAAAMQAILSDADTFWKGKGAAPLAYEYADAMLEARK